MSEKATATYTVRDWKESPVLELEDGEKITRARVEGSYEGDVEGEAASESVMWYRPDGSAVFAGLERIEGAIHGRRGSWVVRSVGSYDGKEARASHEVVRDSATGELEGLTGSATFAAPPGPRGTLELDYSIDGHEPPA